MTGGAMRQRLYHPTDPFPTTRTPEDSVQSIDHFFAKLLKLPKTMKTDSGTNMAISRAQFMVSFLSQLGSEIGVNDAVLSSAVDAVHS